MDSPIEPPRRRWLQFSLRSILVLVVLAAIGFSLWTSNQRLKENRRLQAEVKRLKNEMGELTIEAGQEHKLHAIRVPTIDPRAWKWRVHVPKGRTFFLTGASGNVLQNGKVDGENSSHFPMQLGENIVTVALLDKGQGRWDWFVEIRAGNGSSSSRHGLSPDAGKIIGNCASSSGGVGPVCTSVEPGKELELLRHRMIPKANGKATSFDAPGEGIVVVIQEQTTP